MRYIATVFFSITSLFCFESIQAQQSPGSPYTYFGIGDISNKGFSEQLLVGGTGVASRNPYSINNLNPASYSSRLYSHSFLSEFGLSVSTVRRDDGSNQGFQADMEFPYLGLAFKTGTNSGVAVGLRQYSNVDYFISGENDFNGIPGTYRVIYEGSGGLNEFYIGYGRYITDRLSLGANFSYIFGTIQNDQQINSFDRDFNVNIEDANFLRTLNVDFGIQYTIPLNNSSLTLGATYDLKNDMTSTRDLLITETAPGTGIPIDSLSSEVLDSDDYILPHAFGMGVLYNHRSKWQFNFDIQNQLWSESPLSGNDYALRDSRRASFGVEKLPNYKSLIAINRFSYGFGIFTEQSYLMLDNDGLDNFGITAGVMIPLGGRGIVRIIGERATRGNGLDNFFSESYTKLTMSFTFMDRWFQKRRYD